MSGLIHKIDRKYIHGTIEKIYKFHADIISAQIVTNTTTTGHQDYLVLRDETNININQQSIAEQEMKNIMIHQKCGEFFESWEEMYIYETYEDKVLDKDWIIDKFNNMIITDSNNISKIKYNEKNNTLDIYDENGEVLESIPFDKIIEVIELDYEENYETYYEDYYERKEEIITNLKFEQKMLTDNYIQIKGYLQRSNINITQINEAYSKVENFYSQINSNMFNRNNELNMDPTNKSDDPNDSVGSEYRTSNNSSNKLNNSSTNNSNQNNNNLNNSNNNLMNSSILSTIITKINKIGFYSILMIMIIFFVVIIILYKFSN